MNNVPFDNAESRRIYEKFFKRLSRTFAPVVVKYGLNNLRVLDIGCGYGQYLSHFGIGSVGVDVNKKMVAYCTAHGLSAVRANADFSLPATIGTFDAVWCSNFMEHVVSPHALLREMHAVLRREGLIFVKVPLLPHSFFEFLFTAITKKPPGYRAEEHLYAYTPKTISFIIERAGFEMVEQSLFWPSSIFIRRITDPLFVRSGFTGTFVARKRDGFIYPSKRPV